MDPAEPITPRTRVVRADSPFSSRIEDETVILSLETDNYYGFGSGGSRIWELLAEPLEVRALCDQLRKEYAVDQETCFRDTREFLEQLLREKLIRLLD